MVFHLPAYRTPDFSKAPFIDAPTVTFEAVSIPGVAPENYHATSIYPEYFQVQKNKWVLLEESRMDCVVVREKAGSLSVKEFRHLNPFLFLLYALRSLGNIRSEHGWHVCQSRVAESTGYHKQDKQYLDLIHLVYFQYKHI